jgi:16S rRNA (guanine527-N7)-methyltransferase
MQIIKKYFPDLTYLQTRQMAQLEPLYKDWNEKINVISRKDIDLLYERHVLHSLGIAKVIDFKPLTTILDVGTGGGFPGIPLAILFPECTFHLIDSIGKKIKVVEEVVKALKLTNVTYQHTRAEQIEHKYHFILSRGVTRSKDFLEFVKGKVSRTKLNDLPNGILHLKGGDLTEELQEMQRKHKVFNLKDFFKEEFFETKKVVFVQIV